MQLYQKGCCFGCKVFLSWSANATNNVPTFLYMKGFKSGVTYGPLGSAMLSEIRQRFTRCSTSYNVAQNFRYPLIQKMYISTRKLDGVKDVGTVDYTFTAGGGPPRLQVLVVGIMPVLTTYDPATMNCYFDCKVSMTYYCRLWDRNDAVLAA